MTSNGPTEETQSAAANPGAFQGVQPWLNLHFIRNLIHVWEKGHRLLLTDRQVYHRVLHEEGAEGYDGPAGW